MEKKLIFENRLIKLRCTVFECKYNDNKNSFCNHKKPSIHIGSGDYFTCFEQPLESKKHINYPVRGKLKKKYLENHYYLSKGESFHLINETEKSYLFKRILSPFMIKFHKLKYKIEYHVVERSCFIEDKNVMEEIAIIGNTRTFLKYNEALKFLFKISLGIYNY